MMVFGIILCMVVIIVGMLWIFMVMEFGDFRNMILVFGCRCLMILVLISGLNYDVVMFSLLRILL